MTISTGEPGKFNVGGHLGDPPVPTPNATAGYTFNHCMVRIRDPAESLPFYIDLMGMRTVFTLNGGPFTIYFLGYPKAGEQEEDLGKFAQATLANTANESLLELIHVHGSEKAEGFRYTNGNEPPNLGFGHLGFTVPDVAVALERMKAAGVEIVKELGDVSRQAVPLTDWEAERAIGVGELHEGYKPVFAQIGFVKDPNGYLVELVPTQLK